jgi:hypothetical protein
MKRKVNSKVNPAHNLTADYKALVRAANANPGRTVRLKSRTASKTVPTPSAPKHTPQTEQPHGVLFNEGQYL